MHCELSSMQKIRWDRLNGPPGILERDHESCDVTFHAVHPRPDAKLDFEDPGTFFPAKSI